MPIALKALRADAKYWIILSELVDFYRKSEPANAELQDAAWTSSTIARSSDPLSTFLSLRPGSNPFVHIQDISGEISEQDLC